MHETVADATVEGDVQLEGASIYKSGLSAIAVRRRIGMVFQRPTPFPTMSIRDNVLAGLRILGAKGPSRSESDAIAEEALRRSGLWDEVKDRLRESALGISGGQQQRLCIARALATQPRALLLDEPTASLDPLSTQTIEELVHELRQSIGVVIVTHNMQQAARVSDRTAFMLAGELIESAPTTTLFTNPRDSRTEDYVTGRFGGALHFLCRHRRTRWSKLDRQQSRQKNSRSGMARSRRCMRSTFRFRTTRSQR